FLLLPRPPTSTLFPYTTLFRSRCCPASTQPTDGWVPDPFRAARALSGRRTGRPHSGPCWRAHRTIRDTARTTAAAGRGRSARIRSEEHTSELQSRSDLVCRLLL